MKQILTGSILAMLLLMSTTIQAKPVLSPLFSDNMVLQQSTAAPIWGEAAPGKTVKVSPSWSKEVVLAKADANGKWKAVLNTPSAGGPYRITISDGKKIELNNVMIGEVWICSGQSNMEMPMAGWGKVMNYEQEIADADHPGIRLLQIRKTTAAAPQDEVQATSSTWNVCSPTTVDNFSALAYFYARELNRKLGVPVGVIDVTWGGTPAEAWVSGETLYELPAFRDRIDAARFAAQDEATAYRNYETDLAAWQQVCDKLDKGYAGSWEAFEQNTSGWKTMSVPGAIETVLGDDFDGSVWFRKEITLPKEWLKKHDLKLELGPIDDEDICYFNGKEIARGAGYNSDRHYTVPANLLKEGRNVLAIRVYDTGGGGGILGTPEQFYLADKNGDKISLSGEWYYNKGVRQSELPARPTWLLNSSSSPTVLYNAMLHPLIPYAMQGAIWYQGEANEDRGYQYRDLFSLLIRDWRTQWKRPFPFYYVQLANYKEHHEQPVECNWAEVREAQAMALRLENTGMAVITDFGNPLDIHPKNKQEVGRRLSLIALAKTYGKDIPYSGPVYQSMQVKGNSIELSFTHTDGGLQTQGSLKGFAIAGADHKYHNATAEIKGDKVIVRSENVPYPVAVRYAWDNDPQGTLYNGIGLPASPFRTDDWAGVTYNNQ